MMRIMKSNKDGRGRPPNPWHSYYDKRIFTYVVGISQGYGINPDRFLKKIVEAREKEKSTCETLTIQCRVKTKNYAVFHITRKGKVVTQLRIPNYLLETESKLKINQIP